MSRRRILPDPDGRGSGDLLSARRRLSAGHDRPTTCQKACTGTQCQPQRLRLFNCFGNSNSASTTCNYGSCAAAPAAACGTVPYYNTVPGINSTGHCLSGCARFAWIQQHPDAAHDRSSARHRHHWPRPADDQPSISPGTHHSRKPYPRSAARRPQHLPSPSAAAAATLESRFRCGHSRRGRHVRSGFRSNFKKAPSQSPRATSTQPAHHYGSRA